MFAFTTFLMTLAFVTWGIVIIAMLCRRSEAAKLAMIIMSCSALLFIELFVYLIAYGILPSLGD